MQFKLGDESQHFDRYRMLFRLQLAAALGCLFILLYSIQFHGISAVRVASVGVLVAGAALFVGFVLGFIFCIPRTAKPTEAFATSSSQSPDSSKNDNVSSRKSSALAFSTVETNTNLVDISDWLTKILVGVGLVELNKIPHNLRNLCVFLGPGLRTSDSASFVATSESFAMGVVIFFFGAGFLIGYLWTRLYFQSALAELADYAHGVDRMWFDFTTAEALMDEGRLDDAMRVVNRVLDVNPTNSAALITKGRILKRLAQSGGLPGDKSLLNEALQNAAKAAQLLPDKGGPLYNMACYQALLGDKTGAVKNLKRAIELNPKLRELAPTDEDFSVLLEDAEFKDVIKNPPAAA